MDNREHVKFQAIWDQNTLKSCKYLSFKTGKEDDTVTVSRNQLCFVIVVVVVVVVVVFLSKKFVVFFP